MKVFQEVSISICLIFTMFVPCNAFAESALTNCTDQFIDGLATNAPSIYNSPVESPHGTNQHLCYRDDNVSFYAMEYWPEAFSPRWSAYKLTPQNYGQNGCNTYTRDIANCYISEDSWSDFLSCSEGSDPFHSDTMLNGTKLSKSDFSNTGHDRGHIAPRQAFSWHVCGTYQTFTMANMSPQRAFLNQDIWMYLERQVLTWGIDEGPVYVISGTTFQKFPHQRFQVYQEAVLNPSQIYSRNTNMQTAVTHHQANFNATSKGDLLRPKRNAKSDRVKNKVKDMRIPTGYFKVIYRPAKDGEPAHAIGFLLPHSFENLNLAADQYSNLTKEEAFWLFVSRIDLIEETSGVRFSGIPQAMKSQWGDNWFFANDTSRSNLRSSTCGRGTPQGVVENSTKAQRIAACTDQLH